jgi:glycolate oxidase FAD binding subunit
VVKNVAGYDLGRLVSGSHGSLAAIVSATFKLAPLPVATTTVVAGFRDPEALAQAVMTLSASQIEPAAFDVSAVFEPAPAARTDAALSSHPSWRSSYRLLLQLATTQEAIDAQVAELRRTIAAETLDLLGDAAEADVWRRQTRSPWAAGGTVIRTSWLPARLQGVLALLGDVARAGGGTIQLAGRAGVGAGLIRFDASASAASAAIARLRSRADLVGHVVVLRAERSVKQQIDVWGAPGDHVALLDAVKRAFDPAGVLNAGRGPI